MTAALPMGSRCLGDCCRAFSLPYSPDELVRMLWAYLHDTNCYDDEGRERVTVGEVETIVPMVLPLFFGQHPLWAYAHKLTWFYTCRNLQADGSCAIYERRPRMCREFPHYGGRLERCPYPSCAWDEGRRELPRGDGEVLKAAVPPDATSTAVDTVHVDEPCDGRGRHGVQGDSATPRVGSETSPPAAQTSASP